MDNQNLPKKELNEFDQYMISPVIDEEPNEFQTRAGVLLGLGYIFLFSSIVFMVLSIFNPKLRDSGYDTTLYEVIAQLISGVIVVLSTYFILGKQKILKIIKGFSLKNLGKAFLFVIISFIALMIVSYIEIALFGTNNLSSSNQNGLIIIMKDYTLLSFIFIVIMAPLVEEIIFRYFIFRGSLRVVKPIYAFIITVSIFAGIHYISSISEGTFIKDLRVILEYVVPSFIMTYLYYKNKNLATPIMFHMIFNGYQWIMQLHKINHPELYESISSVIQCLIGG